MGGGEDGRRDGAGEAVVEEIEASEFGEEAKRPGNASGDDIVVEAEPPEGVKLTYRVGDPAAEALPWELYGYDFGLGRALYPDPTTGTGSGNVADPGAESSSGVDEFSFDGLERLEVGSGRVH